MPTKKTCKRRLSCSFKHLMGKVVVWQGCSMFLAFFANMENGKPQGNFFLYWQIIGIFLGLVGALVALVFWLFADCEDCK